MVLNTELTVTLLQPVFGVNLMWHHYNTDLETYSVVVRCYEAAGLIISPYNNF